MDKYEKDMVRKEEERKATAAAVRILVSMATSAVVSIALVEAFIGHLR